MLHWIAANWHPGWTDTLLWCVCVVGWYREGRRGGYQAGYTGGFNACKQSQSYLGWGDYLLKSVERSGDAR